MNSTVLKNFPVTFYFLNCAVMSPDLDLLGKVEFSGSTLVPFLVRYLIAPFALIFYLLLFTRSLLEFLMIH